MSKKWIDKKNATTFNVVHRPHDDSRFYDENAPESVLVPAEDLNDKEHKQARKDKWIMGPKLHNQEASYAAQGRRDNEGEAAVYGITFDDSSYDYMQHLKPIGAHEDAIFISNSGKTEPSRRKADKGHGLVFKEAAPELFAEPAPKVVSAKAYERQQAIPDSIAGLQPDMDPALRETLEALEDDEFIDDEDDDFFGELVQGGEVGDENEWRQLQPKETADNIERKEGEQDWEYAFRKFKLEQNTNAVSDDDGLSSDFGGSDFSEKQDTVGELPRKPRKKKIGAKTDLTGFSMSSSANYRNKGLTLLDDQFDKIEEEYEKEDLSDDEGEFDMSKERGDFNDIMDDFLQNEVVFGKKMWRKDKR